MTMTQEPEPIAEQFGDHPFAQPRLAHLLRLLAVPMLLFWLGLTVVLNMFVPSLEKVGESHTVSMSPTDAPSMQAMMRVGRDFEEFDSDSSAMVLLEGDEKLGPDAHHYYDNLVRQLQQDKTRPAHPGLLG